MSSGKRYRARRWVLATALVAMLTAIGCDSAETRRMRAGDTTPGPQLQVELCRKVSKKGKRQDVGHEFMIGDKSSVLAFTDFSGLSPGRDYTLHLVWIRPDGAELFRRFAEFRLEGADKSWKAVVQWKDALDLNHAQREELPADAPAVTFDSTLNLGTDKKREPGTYHFRVYLDRRLVRDEAFTVVPFQEIPTGGGSGDDDQEKLAPARADSTQDAAKDDAKPKVTKKSTKKSDKSGKDGKSTKNKTTKSKTTKSKTTKSGTANKPAAGDTKPAGGAG
jgi:hypothetical protein